MSGGDSTLDQVVEGVKEIALLKIDVEGHEAAAFTGGRNTLARTKAVVFERWAGDPRSDSAIRQIEEAGFTTTTIDERNMLAVRSESSSGSTVGKESADHLSRRAVRGRHVER